MPDEEPDGFDYVTAKLPRTGKDGTDITGDRVGGGGRHRANGTYSGPVYDISIEDGHPVSRNEHDAAVRRRDELSEENEALSRANYELRTRRREREDARRRQQFEDDFGPLIRWAVGNTVDYAVDRGVYAWTRWGAPFVKRTSQRVSAGLTSRLAKPEEPKTERLIMHESTDVDVVKDLPTMSADEAGRRLSRVALLVELLANEMRALDGVEIGDTSLDVDAVTRKLIEKSSAGGLLTDEETSELEALLLRVREQPPAPPKRLTGPQPS
jgi:hypothetical protein